MLRLCVRSNQSLRACLLALSIVLLSAGHASAKTPALDDRLLGLSREGLTRKFQQKNLRSYQQLDDAESMTFNYATEGIPGAVTFYLKANKTTRWQINDREEMAREYLSEFASGNILFNFGNIRTALLNALTKLPLSMYLEITERRRPIIFIDYYTSGIARHGGSLEFTMRPTDPPTFQDGFYIIRLGDSLNQATDVQTIEGIILHEIMHRVLEHLRVKGRHPCELEREANQKLNELGFGQEFKKAAADFGAKQKGDSPCSDYFSQQETQTPSAP